MMDTLSLDRVSCPGYGSALLFRNMIVKLESHSGNQSRAMGFLHIVSYNCM